MSDEKVGAVSREKWDKLSKEQQTLMRSLGLKPAPKIGEPKEAVPVAVKRQPYTLVVRTHCLLCKQSRYNYFKMLPPEKDDPLAPYLKSTYTRKEEMFKPLKLEIRRDYTCKSCKVWLTINYKKSDLISMVIKLANAAGRSGVIALLTPEESDRINLVEAQLSRMMGFRKRHDLYKDPDDYLESERDESSQERPRNAKSKEGKRGIGGRRKPFHPLH